MVDRFTNQKISFFLPTLAKGECTHFAILDCTLVQTRHKTPLNINFIL